MSDKSKDLAAAAEAGRDKLHPNRDPIYAPDGRTWYDLLLEEAEKRGKIETATIERCAQVAEDFSCPPVSAAIAIKIRALKDQP